MSLSFQTQHIQAVSLSFLQFETIRKFHHDFTCKTKLILSSMLRTENFTAYSDDHIECLPATSVFTLPYIKIEFSFTSPPLACSVLLFFMPVPLPTSHCLSYYLLHLQELSTSL